MTRFFSACSAFMRSAAGLAAVEFALIAPIMIALFFGVVESSGALAASRRTLLASNTLADLVAQETQILKSDLDDLFIGMEDVIDPQDIDVTFRVISVTLDTADNKVKVDWSYDSTGAQPYAAGSEYSGSLNVALFDDTSSLIVAETLYDYASPISKKVIGPLSFEKAASRWPRRTARVRYCAAAGACV
ncbi:MAG: TadE/TadG family type IV pilus assembly protein [Parvularculaceae bacterium]|nr:TadE/TadG family type IV pilus assembly protein [Parvularculaceae bacterium]